MGPVFLPGHVAESVFVLLNQHFLERFAHGEMERLSCRYVHHIAGFRVLGRPWSAGSDRKTAKIPDFHPTARNEGTGHFLKDKVHDLYGGKLQDERPLFRQKFGFGFFL